MAQMPVYGTQPIGGARAAAPPSATQVGAASGAQGDQFAEFIQSVLLGLGGWALGGPLGGLGGFFLGRQGGLFGGDQGPSPTEVQAERITENIERTGPSRRLGSRAEEGLLASPEAFETWLGNLPRDLADAAVMSAEQNAAMNAINQARHLDWQNLMRGAYGEAMGAAGQMRGMYA